MANPLLSSLRVLQSDLGEDEIFTAFNKVMTQIAGLFSYGSLNEEIMMIHQAREGRDLYLDPSIPKSDRISKAILKNSADRSRLVELLIPLKRYRKTINKNLQAINNYLQVHYGIAFEGIKTKGDRELVIETLLGKAHGLLSDVEAVIESIEEIIHDIDQSGFATKDTVALVEVVHRNLSISTPGSR